MTPMTPMQALALFGGTARTRQLLERGCSPYAIRTAVDDGVVSKIRRGVYALADAPPERVQATSLGAGITCVSALAKHGLPLPRPPVQVHLAVPRNFNPAAQPNLSARLHYQAHRPIPGDVASVGDALDCAGDCLDETWHLVAVDAALNKGLITMGEVMAFRRTSKERRDFLIRYADGRSQAPGETIARLRLVQAGFKVCPQAYIEGAGQVDIEVESLLIVQVDGYEPHSGKSAFRRDREKSRAVVKAGRPQLSYAASELLGVYAADVVRDAQLALEEWRARDPARIRPSGRQVLRITRDQPAVDPSGA